VPPVPFGVIGGLISYSTVPNDRDLAAQYVAPIVKGAKPGDLPVQQPQLLRW